MSLTDPSSLFAVMTLTSTVSYRTAASTSSTSTLPSGRGATTSRWQSPRSANHRAAASTAGCSTAVVTTCGVVRRASRAAHTIPLMARLSASVPPEVNTTSWGLQCSAPATCSRASSTTVRASWPAACGADALAASIHDDNAARAPGRGGVLAAWSR